MHSGNMKSPRLPEMARYLIGHGIEVPDNFPIRRLVKQDVVFQCIRIVDADAWKELRRADCVALAPGVESDRVDPLVAFRNTLDSRSINPCFRQVRQICAWIITTSSSDNRDSIGPEACADGRVDGVPPAIPEAYLPVRGNDPIQADATHRDNIWGHHRAQSVRSSRPTLDEHIQNEA